MRVDACLPQLHQLADALMGFRFAPLEGSPGFGAEAEGSVSPDVLARIDEAACSELTTALDEHALLVLRLSEAAEPSQLAAFAKRMWGERSCLDFSATAADAASGTGRPCTTPGVPEVRVLGNTTEDGSKDSLLCRIG